MWRMNAIAGCLLLVAGMTAVVAGEVRAEPGTEALTSVQRTPEVVISLNGGLPGPNLGRILSNLVANGVEIPKRQVAAQKGDTVCGMLDVARMPPPCSSYYPALQRLNGRSIEQLLLRPGETLWIPNLEIEKARRTRVYSRPRKGTVSQTLSKWSKFSPQQTTVGEDIRLDYDSYILTIPVTTDADATRVAESLRILALDNVTIDTVLQTPPPAKLFDMSGDASDAVETACRSGTLTGDHPYRDWANPDQSAMPLAGAVRATTVVYLVDTPLVRGPNLTAAPLGEGVAAPAWTCKWRTPEPKDHATHLAGIIASRPNGYGFVGLAPSSQVESVVWSSIDASGAPVPDPNASGRLADQMQRDARGDGPLSTYLAALSFGIWDGSTSFNANMRFSKEPVAAIRETRRLIVVAAGQAEGRTAEDINAGSRLAPQNLGDQENVVVVTACDNCTPKGARLLEQANFSTADPHFVHVAAPGGSPLPGWLDGTSVGASPGTSESAAYVAGVASAMIGAYPGYYVEARKVKERLQVTSRPLPRFRLDDSPNPDLNKIAAGIVDPDVALLDPRKHWIKQAGVWKAIQIKAVNITLLDEGGNIVEAQPRWLRRILSTPDDANQNAWTALETSNHDNNVPIGNVTTIRDLRPSTDSTITSCGGEVHKVLDYEDVIFAESGWNGDEC